MSSHNDSFVASGNSPTNSGKIPPDFVVENHCNIVLLKSRTPKARSWVEEHIGDSNGYQPFYPYAVEVEPRYITEIVARIQNDGLMVGRD